MSATVSILIPTMSDSRYVIELCLKSIQKYTLYPDYHIVVCDAGVDEETRDYLKTVDFIRLITATDPGRPKDDLVRAVDTDYYILMHDDIQIIKPGWLQRRINLMEKHRDNAIVGAIAKNGGGGRRFLPLALLVKTEISRELDLVWGKQWDQGKDTGKLAYDRFFSQKQYKFRKYKPNKDIYHFAEMGWVMNHTAETYPADKLDKLLSNRQKKIHTIRNILESQSY